MQNSFVPQKYPDRIVPESFMNHATTVDDISNHITYDLCQDMNKCIGKLLYSKEGMYIDLGEFRLVIKSDSSAYLAAFDTANLDGVSHEHALRSNGFDHIHILSSPVKYLGRELFAKVLDVCAKYKISVLTLTPLHATNSFFFYEKMCKYFSDRVVSFYEVDGGDLIVNLK